jgi:hypothetical protein
MMCCPVIGHAYVGYGNGYYPPVGTFPQGRSSIKGFGRLTFMKDEPLNMDGLFFDFMKNRGKARVYSQ